MRRLLTAVCLAALTLPGVAIAGDQAKTGEDKLAKMLEGRVAGSPVSCIPIDLTNESTTIDKTAIVYRSGSRLYVNRPRTGATSLNDDQILISRTHGSQLCSLDPVDLMDRSSRTKDGFIILGDFTPYDKAK